VNARHVAAALRLRTRWFFDLDGTMIDSAHAHERAFLITLGEVWPSGLGHFHYDDHRGRATREVFAGLGVDDPSLIATMVRRKQALYRQYIDDGAIAVMPGCFELLRELKRLQCHLYVVTGASHMSAQRALRMGGLARFFDGMITADDVSRGKPDPEIYREACRRFTPHRESAVAVEDSPQGVRSACGAGLLTLRVPGDRVSEARTSETEPLITAGSSAVSFAGLDDVRRHLSPTDSPW
jgi:HAD superfamily hydrolase (TIGR01509 family)